MVGVVDLLCAGNQCAMNGIRSRTRLWRVVDGMSIQSSRYCYSTWRTPLLPGCNSRMHERVDGLIEDHRSLEERVKNAWRTTLSCGRSAGAPHAMNWAKAKFSVGEPRLSYGSPSFAFSRVCVWWPLGSDDKSVKDFPWRLYQNAQIDLYSRLLLSGTSRAPRLVLSDSQVVAQAELLLVPACPTSEPHCCLFVGVQGQYTFFLSSPPWRSWCHACILGLS